MKKILILGAGGLMGKYLAEQLTGGDAGLQVVACRKNELDITDPAKSARVLEGVRPDIVVNAAAFCRMEECEVSPDFSSKVNAEAPAWWSRACHKEGIPFLHLSTDYVFGGERNTPYRVEDEPQPLSVYGRHKRKAELAVLAFPEHIVFRCAWIFGLGGPTFMSRIPVMLANEEVLKVATGRVGACLYARYAGQIFRELLSKDLFGPDKKGGIYHLTHSDPVTWMEFAEECKRQMLEKGMSVKNREIVPVPAPEHYALKAQRPDYSVLDLSKTEALLGRKLTPWREGLSGFLDEIPQS